MFMTYFLPDQYEILYYATQLTTEQKYMKDITKYDEVHASCTRPFFRGVWAQLQDQDIVLLLFNDRHTVPGITSPFTVSGPSDSIHCK